MSNNASQLDLSQLAVEREPAAKPQARGRRAWLTRVVLPGGILLGFLSLFGWAARDSFLPAQSVTVTPVVVSRAEVQQEGTPLFQAAGWIEPRPTPVVASSLAPGVILDMLVIEGQHVEKGEPVAILIDTDARLALAQAKAKQTLQQAEVSRAEATLAAAKTNLAKPVNLQASLADAGALLAETQLAVGNLPYALEAAKTNQQLAEENVRRKELAGDAITGRVLREARAELATATNMVNELTARKPTLAMQMKSLQQKWDASAEKLKLLTEETRALAEAEANLAVAKAKAEQAALQVKVAELRLDSFGANDRAVADYRLRDESRRAPRSKPRRHQSPFGTRLERRGQLVRPSPIASSSRRAARRCASRRLPYRNRSLAKLFR